MVGSASQHVETRFPRLDRNSIRWWKVQGKPARLPASCPVQIASAFRWEIAGEILTDTLTKVTINFYGASQFVFHLVVRVRGAVSAPPRPRSTDTHRIVLATRATMTTAPTVAPPRAALIKTPAWARRRRFDRVRRGGDRGSDSRRGSPVRALASSSSDHRSNLAASNLRELLAGDEILRAPCAHDALTAALILSLIHI